MKKEYKLIIVIYIAILFLGGLLMGYMASNMLYQYSRINELERENKELVDRLYN